MYVVYITVRQWKQTAVVTFLAVILILTTLGIEPPAAQAALPPCDVTYYGGNNISELDNDGGDPKVVCLLPGEYTGSFSVKGVNVAPWNIALILCDQIEITGSIAVQYAHVYAEPQFYEGPGNNQWPKTVGSKDFANGFPNVIVENSSTTCDPLLDEPTAVTMSDFDVATGHATWPSAIILLASLGLGTAVFLRRLQTQG